MIETAQAVGPETFEGLAESFEGCSERPPTPQVPLLARVPFTTALRFCGLFLGMWIVGIWFAHLQKTLTGLHTACEVVGACGCLLFIASSYVAIRAWQFRHPR